MKPLSVMLIAGEASGDLLAAELVEAMRDEMVRLGTPDTRDPQPLRTELGPRFFGAGGTQMAKAGVELACDLTQHAVTGLSEVAKSYLRFRRVFHQLLRLARERRPDVVVCVDFSGFNRRFAHALRRRLAAERGLFHNWRPKIVQYVSPQVWASRADRAYQIAADFDLLLCTFPHEVDWYARRVPQFRVEFVGNPIVERHGAAQSAPPGSPSGTDNVLLLPGSRRDELRRHLPVLLATAKLIAGRRPAAFRMILPREELVAGVRATVAQAGLDIVVQAGGLAAALAQTRVAISKTGTILMECALFGVPAVAFYKTSWPTYWIAKQVVRVPYLSMPNLLAGEAVFPEFIQGAATPEALAEATLSLLGDAERRRQVQEKLAAITAQLGPPGASRRAACALLDLLGGES